MADRYWVGGTANWDGTAGTKWATTSGGAGGASVPTAADDVFFDAASGTVTCTIASGNTGAKSINCTGFTGTITQATNINVAGSVTLVAGMTYTTSGFPTTTFTANATLTTAGKNYAGVVVNGVGITVTLGDALTTNGLTVTVTNGTFDTANYNVTCPNFNSSNSNVRGFTLGSSTCTLTTGNNVVDFTTGTNLTFNAGTSQINCSAVDASLNASGQTFYNVAFTNTSAGTRGIRGNNTFNNLSVTAPSSAGVAQLTFNANQTINGTLSTTGTAGNRRVWFRSDTYGVRRTLTVNSAPSLTDADFRDIIVNGTAAPISGTRIGNRGACAGITFDTPKTVYWNLSGNQVWATANAWASTSGGTPNTDNFPLPQDTAVFDNTGVVGIVSVSGVEALPTVDMSARTTAMTFSSTNPSTCYGSWINGSGTTISGSFTITFSGEGTKTITSAGKTFSCPITIDAYGGTVELADALNISNNLTVTNGTFDTKNFNVTLSGIISSDNSNVRTIKLGSSTITSSSNSTMFWFANSTNLTFDSGTSQVTLTDGSGALTNASGVVTTFYNVTFTGASFAGQRLIVGSCIFNNLTFNVSGGTNTMSETSFGANQVVNGTLTVTGTTALRRVMFLSNTVGTPRTLTVNTLVADDCDFRDITIAGSAAGASPTRAGDCGGNSGITFPSPKTVYRVGTNTSWVGSSSWATTSGGTGDNNNFPLAQDTAVIDNSTALSGTLELVGAFYKFNVGSLDMSSRTNAITVNFNEFATAYFAGSVTFGSGITITGTGNSLFTGRGTMTFTCAGKTIPFRITVNSFSGTFQLGDAFNSSNSLTHSSGTFDAVSYNVTVSTFNNNSTSTASVLRMGSGLWTLSGTGTVWNTGTLTFLKGTADILLSNTSTTARTFSGGGQSYNKLTIGGTTGTSTTTITGNNQFTELASTKTVAHTIALGTTTQTFGAWTVTGSAGNVVTLTGSGTNHVLAGSATSGIDYLAMGSIGFAATSPAEFYAGANSTGTAAAPVFRTAPPTPRTLYWVGGTGNWSDTARWSLSSGGAGGESPPTSLDDVVFDSASNATAYTATVNTVTGGVRCKALTIAPPASGNITLAGGTAIVGIHGDVTLPATGLTRTYTGTITLSGSTTGKTFTTNGVGLTGNVTINGVGCGWTLGSAFSTANTFTVTNGSFDTGNFNVTCANLSSTNSNTRSITLGSSTFSTTVSSAINFTTGTNLTFNAGTSQINVNASSPLFFASGQTFYNVTIASTGCAITGANTFNNLTITAGFLLSSHSINANQTITGTLTCSGVSAIQRNFLRSDTIGTTRTLTVGTLAANDCDFRDITIAGTAAGTAPTRAGDCGGNSGITFPAPKTVYYSVAGTSNWGATTWAFTNGGTADITAFPLAQDTAVFPSSPTPYPSSGNTVTVNFSYNIGTIDMSARTTDTMTLATGSTTPTIYGNWINGTGTTLTGSSTITFSGRGTMAFTSAGKTIPFPITVDSPTGTFQLGDAFLISNTLLLTRGTFDAVSYNVTCGAFGSNNSNTRTITLGTGPWFLIGTGTVWNLATTTGLTFNKDTSEIRLTAVSTTARTFAGGGLTYNKLVIGGGLVSTTTITGNNTFSEISETKTVANTINLGTTSQRVGAFTVTGTAGNVVSITGNTSNLIYTGGGTITGLDYLNIQGRVYGPNGEITGIWNAGANSINSGSLGWVFDAAPTPPASNSNFFLMFA